MSQGGVDWSPVPSLGEEGHRDQATMDLHLGSLPATAGKAARCVAAPCFYACWPPSHMDGGQRGREKDVLAPLKGLHSRQMPRTSVWTCWACAPELMLQFFSRAILLQSSQNYLAKCVPIGVWKTHSRLLSA